MPKYIPPKLVLGKLTNHQKRYAYMTEDCNWKAIETSESLRLEQLNYTPFVRVLVKHFLPTINKPHWSVIAFRTLNQDETIHYAITEAKDIMEYLKQQAWQHKQEQRGF